MTEWEKNRGKEKTLKCQRWVIACGRKGFTTNNVKKDTYICSIHFEGGKGPTMKYPNPIKAEPLPSNLEVKSEKRMSPTKRGSPKKKH